MPAFKRLKELMNRETLVFGFEVAAFYLGISTFTDKVVGPTICIGPSMMPTINSGGEFALVDKYSYRYGKSKYQRGDVIIAYTPTGKKICKRIRALEGDIVYNRISPTVVEKVVLGKGDVWVQGDNPSNSMDSRMYGPIPLSSLEGRVFWKMGIIASFVSNEFQYMNIDDERNDTKVMIGAVKNRPGGLSDDQVPHGEYPDPTEVMKRALGLITEKQSPSGLDKTQQKDDNSLTTTDSSSTNSDIPSSNSQNTNSPSAHCQGIIHGNRTVSSAEVSLLSSQRLRKDLEESPSSAKSKNEPQSASLISSWLYNNVPKKSI